MSVPYFSGTTVAIVINCFAEHKNQQSTSSALNITANDCNSRLSTFILLFV